MNLESLDAILKSVFIDKAIVRTTTPSDSHNSSFTIF